MTLHPWPLNDTRAGDHAAVLWTGPHGLGLLADSLAVPLRFVPEADSPAATSTAKAEAAPEDAIHPSALLRLREIGCRFGSNS